jgi:transposase-like protein
VAGPARYSAARLRELLADDLWLDELIDRADEGGVSLTGPGGFLPELIKAVLERGLAVELTEHLGYEHGDAAGRGSPNSRNGHSPKTVQTEIGPVPLAVPRDRNSSFEPRLVPKGERRLGGLDDMIISKDRRSRRSQKPALPSLMGREAATSKSGAVACDCSTSLQHFIQTAQAGATTSRRCCQGRARPSSNRCFSSTMLHKPTAVAR